MKYNRDRDLKKHLNLFSSSISDDLLDAKINPDNRDPIFIAQSDPGFSGKIDPWMYSPEQNFYFSLEGLQKNFLKPRNYFRFV
jgi:hypothetical protein